MFIIHEDTEKKPKTSLDEGSPDRSFGLQEGRNLCKKILERAKASNTGGYYVYTVKDSIIGVLDGLNMQILQIPDKNKSEVLSQISVLLDDAFTELSKIK